MPADGTGWRVDSKLRHMPVAVSSAAGGAKFEKPNDRTQQKTDDRVDPMRFLQMHVKASIVDCAKDLLTIRTAIGNPISRVILTDSFYELQKIYIFGQSIQYLEAVKMSGIKSFHY